MANSGFELSFLQRWGHLSQFLSQSALGLCGCSLVEERDLVTGTISNAAKGPTAIHTKLGSVLSGPIAVRGPKQQI